MLLFLNICKQTFYISYVRITQKVKGIYDANSSTYYSHIKTKILEDFQILTSVPFNYFF